MNASARTIETSRCRFSYTDVGEGPALLCLHGTGPGASGLGNYAGVLEELSREFRLIIPDLPGFGASTITKDDDEPWCRMAAAELHQFLEKLGVKRINLLGNSAGGAVSVHMALARPEMVPSLTLMGCHGLRVPLFTPREMSGVQLMRSYHAKPTLEKMKALIETFFYDPKTVDVEKIAKERYEKTSQGMMQGNERIARGRPNSVKVTTDELAKLSMPTLLIWGRDDRFVGVDDGLVFAASIPDARLVLLSKCGHWAQIERRADFVAQVRGFVNMIERGGKAQ
jgi:4,5:9,10-diseco-3-hydroxy-5,9,17-trioxoandrosta-1(10),2-diene-4-oate hydrolase